MVTKPSLQYIPIEYLERGRYQPRTQFDKQALQELADSIAIHGLMEPLIVRLLDTHRYEIIAGERRWRAAMLACLCEVPCLVGSYSEEEAATLSIVENIQRQDLNIIDETKAYQRLRTEFHFSQEDIAKLVGKSRSHIANLLRLLHLSEKVQDRIKANELSLGHARLLLQLSPKEQEALAQKIIEEAWSVRQLEQRMRAQKDKAPPKSQKETIHDITYLENQLADQLGTPVHILQEETGSGWLKIKFFSAETLSGLLEQLGFSYD